MHRSIFILPLVFIAGMGTGHYWLSPLSGNISPAGASAPSSEIPGKPDGPGGSRKAGEGRNSPTGPASIPNLAGISAAEVKTRLDAISDPEVRSAALRQCLAAMPRSEWGGWMKKFFEKEERKPEKIDFRAQANRYGWLDDLFTAITAVDPVGFMAAQDSKGQRNNDAESEARLLVMVKWAETNPEAAKTFLSAQLASGAAAPGLSDSVRNVAKVLAKNGHAAAVIEWAAAFPDRERAAATSAALGQMADDDPRAAAEWLGKLKDLPELNTSNLRLNAGNLAAEVAASLARTAPSEALAWAAEQTGAMREKGLDGALKDWAARDFDSALTAVRSLNGEARTTGLSVLLGQAQPERLSEVAGLIETQPDTPERIAASAQVMSAWTRHSPEQASEWMARQPPGEIRDSAITAFVRWADVRDPEAGLLWAGSMSDPSKRMDAITHIIQQLGPKAPEAVQPWLLNNGQSLSEAERGQVLEKLKQPR